MFNYCLLHCTRDIRICFENIQDFLVKIRRDSQMGWDRPLKEFNDILGKHGATTWICKHDCGLEDVSQTST